MKLAGAIVLLGMIYSSFALASSRGQREHGAAVYAANGCQHCHTISSTGGHKGPDLSGVGRRKSKSAMREQILFGTKSMPGFADILEKKDLNDLLAYLRSCRQKPLKPAQMPAVNGN
jgi:mono/diheme cytochrome c family protein